MKTFFNLLAVSLYRAVVSARVEEMAVEGCLAGDPTMIYRAICFDPLTAAVLSLREIRAMVDEMFRQFKEYLPQFRHLS